MSRSIKEEQLSVFDGLQFLERLLVLFPCRCKHGLLAVPNLAKPIFSCLHSVSLSEMNFPALIWVEWHNTERHINSTHSVVFFNLSVPTLQLSHDLSRLDFMGKFKNPVSFSQFFFSKQWILWPHINTHLESTANSSVYKSFFNHISHNYYASVTLYVHMYIAPILYMFF